jgi:hypothetical protein
MDISMATGSDIRFLSNPEIKNENVYIAMEVEAFPLAI